MDNKISLSHILKGETFRMDEGGEIFTRSCLSKPDCIGVWPSTFSKMIWLPKDTPVLEILKDVKA